MAYDRIIMLNMLEHLAEPVDMLARLSNCLSNRGSIHITVPLAGSLHRWLGVEMGMIHRVDELAQSDVELGHYRVYMPEMLRDHVTAAGRCIRITSLGWDIPLSNFPKILSLCRKLSGRLSQI